jgi:benzylsuccinate CoA-transferase BbsF subunit
VTAVQSAPATMAARVIPAFRGIRIADFSWVIAAPMATEYLAIHGADVIRIETRSRPDVIRGALPFPSGGQGPNDTAYYANFNQGKRGITLNLRHPRSVELALRLVATCDAAVENYVPGTLARLGLGYDALRAVRPDLVLLSTALAGQTGPNRGFRGFGNVIQGSAGITHLTGWPDRPPVGTGVPYTDFVTGHIAAAVLMAALDHRARTGEGQYIDLSQQEAGLECLDAALLEYTANGTVMARAGNRHPSAAPHGVFLCRPDDAYLDDRDRWLALAAFTDADWRALVAAMGTPEWAAGPRFRTLLGRKAHEDELEQRIGDWTGRHAAREAETILRRHGVPVSVVAASRDLFDDDQLQARGHWVAARHPSLGDFPLQAPTYRLDGVRPDPPRHPPLLGGDNEAVYRDLLGLSAAEYVALAESGAFE